MKSKLIAITILFIISSMLFQNCDSGDNSKPPILSSAQKDTIKAATQAYIAGFPLVIMESTKNQFINFEIPINQFALKQEFISASDTSVVRPNVDTYYSVAFLDLTKGPQVLDMPRVDSAARYYMMPMLDAYTNVFKSPGTRTSYVKGGKYLIVGPSDSTDYENDNSITEIFHAPTSLVWILGRFEVDNAMESAIVSRVQEKFTLSPYGQATPNIPKPIRNLLKFKGDLPTPNQIVNGMSIQTFFNQMNRLLPANPLNPSDPVLAAELAKIGVGTGAPFNLNSFSGAVQAALKNIPQTVITSINQYYTNGSGEKGWTVNLDTLMGNYGTDYFLRAVIAYEGLGANQIEDAVYYANSYDSLQNQLTGVNNYTLTFPKEKLPPVNGFWSLTMYEPNGNLYDNSASIYVLGHNTDRPFQYNGDSSLTLYIQHEQPSDPNLANNWLPAPENSFNVLLRAYYPKDAILDTLWTPPLFIKE